MDEHRTVSLSRTYAPHEYVVHLSPQDRERFAGIEREVTQELSAYLLEHARAERLALVATPVIELRTDERLGLGEFGIETRPRAGRRRAGRPRRGRRAPPPPAPSHTMIVSESERSQERLEEARGATRRGRAILAAEGKRFVIGPSGATIGRSRECDVVLGDSNVSRQHARIALGEDGAVDRRGPRLDERRAGQRRARRRRGSPLRSGDRLDLGTVSARFEVE